MAAPGIATRQKAEAGRKKAVLCQSAQAAPEGDDDQLLSVGGARHEGVLLEGRHRGQSLQRHGRPRGYGTLPR
jgi:hypothetical protein